MREHQRTCDLLSRVLVPLGPAIGDTGLATVRDIAYDLVRAGNLDCAQLVRDGVMRFMRLARNSTRPSRKVTMAASPLAAQGVRTQPLTFATAPAADLARELCVIDTRLFAGITSDEILAWGRSSGDRSGSPHIVQMISHFNALSKCAPHCPAFLPAAGLCSHPLALRPNHRLSRRLRARLKQCACLN